MIYEKNNSFLKIKNYIFAENKDILKKTQHFIIQLMHNI